MELIYGFAASLCVTLLGVGAFSLLAPKGSLEGMVKFALSLFLVAGFLLPFFGNTQSWERLWDSSRWEQPAEDLSEMVEQVELEVSQTMINEQITLLLEQEGYSPQKVDSRIHTASDGSIEITELVVWMPQADKTKGSAIRRILAEQAGLETVTIEWG